ncbi:protein translocase subunit SecF [Candidatus Woesearchaeota archaeon]|nr:MAG: protein translocase subunit SecF [Candidatus Woesearchaeota archaeon]
MKHQEKLENIENVDSSKTEEEERKETPKKENVAENEELFEKKEPKVEIIKEKKKKKKFFFKKREEKEKVKREKPIKEKKPKKLYQWLLLIPFIILILAIVQICVQSATTGDFIYRDASLKGGSTITVYKVIEPGQLQESLQAKFPDKSIVVKKLNKAGKQAGVIIDVDIDINKREDRDSFEAGLLEVSPVELTQDDYDIRSMGSTLGEGFFKEVVIAMVIAFVLMGVVVFGYFRNFVPSIAVILAAFSDIVITLAIVNILGIRISIAGIAAFLMLIGYSIDTDILLSTRVLKTKESNVKSRIKSAMKTGLTMTFTTLAAVSIAFFVSTAPPIKQIMTILLIGLIVDLMNTWIQNAGILRWFAERKFKHGQS